MANIVYNHFKRLIQEGSIDLENDTINVALLADTYTPNQDHDFWSDVNANEISGTGYTAGGEALTTKTVTQDNTDDEGVFDADDVTWTGADFTCMYAVVYKDTGTASTSTLICCFDFGGNKSPAGEDFTIQWSGEGVVNIG